MIEHIKVRERKLAMITGISPIRMPYMNHKNTPMARKMNMAREISFADLVLYIFSACGIRAEVVIIPAIIPITFEKFS